MKHILFVCTGNTFRSASAEYLFKHLLAQKHDRLLSTSSAGTRGNPLGMYQETIDYVAHYGGDMSRHQYRILNQDIIDKADVIICMSQHHRDKVLKTFSRDSYLFNELAYDQVTDLKDDAEAYGEYADLKVLIHQVVDTIFLGLPVVYEKLKAMNL